MLYDNAPIDPEEQPNGQEPEPQKPDDKRNNVAYWLRWIKGARKASKETWQEADAAWREFDNGKRCSDDSSSSDDKGRLFPLYWQCCDTVSSAYYAKTPKLIARRKFDIEDPDALTAGLIAERLAEHLRDNCAFDATMSAAVSDLLHASKTTTQLVTKQTIEVVQVPVPVMLAADGVTYLTQDGQPVTDVQQDAQGQLFTLSTIEKKRTSVGIKPVIYDELIHDPEASCEEDITAIGLHFVMDYDEAKERFLKNEDGSYKDIILPFKSNTNYHDDERDKDRDDLPGKYLEGWEIWDKKTQTVYFVSCDYSEAFLDSKPDLYKLRRFFPIAPLVITNKPKKNLYPRPVYSRLRPTLEKLHDLYARKFDLIDGIRRRCLVDGSEPDLVDALNSLESGAFIACKNLQALLDKGGVQNLILWIPVAELISAISEINSLEAEFKNLVYEWFGVPDILRGVSDPQEALGTQQIKSTAAHDRFKVIKMRVQELARNSLEMMLDLAVHIMEPEEIQEIIGFKYLSQEHQRRFPAGLEILKDDASRIVRLDLETDSTSFIDQQAEVMKRKAITDTVINGLAMIGKMENQEFAPVVIQALLYNISAAGGSKEFEDGVMKSVKQLIDRKNQPQEPAPPPPDYEAMKIELKQMEGQQKAAIEMRKLDQKEIQLSLEERDREFSRELEVLRADLDAQMQKFVQASESMRLENERYQVIMTQREKLIEEQRLALDAAIAMQQKPSLPETPAPPQVIHVSPPEMPPITINLKQEPRKRSARIVRDELGNAAIEIDDAAPSLVAID